MIRAILFDFNGVIINDEPIQFAAYQKILADRGMELTERDYYASLGMDDWAFVRANFARAGREYDDQSARDIVEAKSAEHRRIMSEDLPLFPGVVTFIKDAARHFSVGVVSMARRVEIDYVLERAGLADTFPMIISTEDAKACKPDPDCYLRGRSRLNLWRDAQGKQALSPTEILVIEDSPPGVRAARAAELYALGVTNTVSAEELRAAGANVVTNSLADWTADAVRHLFDDPRWLTAK